MNIEFLRPEWLWAALSNLIWVFVWWQKRQIGQWFNQQFDQQFLQQLAAQSGKKASALSWLLGFVFINGIVITAAGPSLRSIEIDANQEANPIVILLDQSVSMMAEDVQPSRLIQAQRFIRNILANNPSNPAAVYVYSGSAHRLVPLTQDHKTIEFLVEQISPWTMPSTGSNAKAAFELALKDLKQQAVQQAHLVLITDEILTPDLEYLRQFEQFDLSIFWLGSQAGSPIPAANNGFIRINEQLVIATTNINDIEKLAIRHTVNKLDLSLDVQFKELEQQASLTTITFKEDAGFWLIPFIMILFILLIKQRLIYALPLFMIGFVAQPAHSFDWDSLWQNQAQRAQSLAQQNDFAAAEKLDNKYKGFAAYQAGDIDSAINEFSQAPQSAIDHYNLGTAQIKAQQLEKAIENLQTALNLDPTLSAAQQNLPIAKQLLEQQQNSENQQQSSEQNNEQQDQQQNSEQQDGDQQSEQQDAQSEQQSSEQQSSEQQAQDSEQSNEQSDSSKQQNEQAMQQQAQENNSSEQQQLEQEMQEQLKAAKDDPQALESTTEPVPVAMAEPEWDKEQQELDELLNEVPQSNINFLNYKFEYQLQRQPQEYRGQAW